MGDRPNLKTRDPEGAVAQATNIDYKEKLDYKADEARRPAQGDSKNTSTVEAVVEKVAEYVPPVAKMLGVEENKEQPALCQAPGGPPERPHHDPQIEEFVRDQHRSKDGDRLV